MPAPLGNEFWKARTKHGRDKLFESAETLWEACQEYFQWIDENPLPEEKLFAYQGEVTRETIYKMHAMTIDGLCLFLDIDDSTWQRWREDEDFYGVVAKADKIIRAQKFAGAAADLLNANIIARDLGLVDKKEEHHKGTIGVSEMSEQQIDEQLAKLVAKALADG